MGRRYSSKATGLYRFLCGVKCGYSVRNPKGRYIVNGLIDVFLVSRGRQSVSRFRFEEHLNGKDWRSKLPRFSQVMAEEHVSGRETLYYVGPHETEARYTLACIDIDVDDDIDPFDNDAPWLARWIEANFLSNLYDEPSTGLKGRHAYFIYYRGQYGKEEANTILNAFASWLSVSAKAEGFISYVCRRIQF